MLDITVTNKQSNDKRPYKFTQTTILIGRQQNCDIILESHAVSRRHAKITINKNQVSIEDLGSGNGTMVNSNRIPSKDRHQLSFGDTIRIEEFEIKCNLDASDIPDDPPTTEMPGTPQIKTDQDADMLEIKMIKKVLGALDQDKIPSITIADDDFKGLSARFEDGMEELAIGRDPGCQLTVNSSVMSRRHAVLSLKWGGYVITDLDSKNKTFVNGEPVTEKALKDGDEITFGTIKAIFKNPQEFDIGSIGQSLTQAKKKNFEDTTSFEVDDIKNKDQDKVSQTAQASADAENNIIKPETEGSKEKAENKTNKDKKETKNENAEADLDGLLEDKQDETATQNKTQSKSKPKNKNTKKTAKSKFTITEILLFGFVLFIMIGIVSVLIMLFV